MADVPVEPPAPSLLERIEAYMRQFQLTHTQFGTFSLGSPSFVTCIRQGRQPRRKTIDRVEAFMAAPPSGGRTRRTRGSAIAAKYRKAVAANFEIEEARRIHRATDPHEQAKLFLQCQRMVVVNASTYQPGLTGYVVGQRRVTADELLDIAKRKGWTPNV